LLLDEQSNVSVICAFCFDGGWISLILKPLLSWGMLVTLPMPWVTYLQLGLAAWADRIMFHNDDVRQYQQAIPLQRAYRQRPSNYHMAAVTLCSVIVERPRERLVHMQRTVKCSELRRGGGRG